MSTFMAPQSVTDLRQQGRRAVVQISVWERKTILAYIDYLEQLAREAGHEITPAPESEVQA